MSETMTAHADLLPRYKQLRKVGLELNNRLVKTLTRSVMDEGGRKLGILEGDALMLDTEDAMSVLMDYCIHDVRRYGLNAIESYLKASPPTTDSDEWVLLQALRASRFSLVAVESSEPEVGVNVRELLRDEPMFLVDIGFSRTASVGMVLAARLMAPEGINMTTGAALPVGRFTKAGHARLLEDLQESFKGMDFRNLAPEEASDLAGNVLGTCLAEGAAERIAYIKPGSQRGRRSRGNRSTPAKRTKPKKPAP